MADPACTHCPDGHATPQSRPWGVYVSPSRDGDGQPTHLVAQPSNSAHVAQSDADWLWQLIRDYRPPFTDDVGPGSRSEAVGLALGDAYAGIEFEDPTFERGTAAVMAALREHATAEDPRLAEIRAVLDLTPAQLVDQWDNYTELYEWASRERVRRIRAILDAPAGEAADRD